MSWLHYQEQCLLSQLTLCSKLIGLQLLSLTFAQLWAKHVEELKPNDGYCNNHSIWYTVILCNELAQSSVLGHNWLTKRKFHYNNSTIDINWWQKTLQLFWIQFHPKENWVSVSVTILNFNLFSVELYN